jgi:hypothetical protein
LATDCVSLALGLEPQASELVGRSIVGESEDFSAPKLHGHAIEQYSESSCGPVPVLAFGDGPDFAFPA